MATLQDFRNERIKKLEQLKSFGVNPYPAKASHANNAGDVVASFDELEGKKVAVAGRVISIRKFGKLAFIGIRDFSGEIQLFIKDGDLAELDAKKGQLGIAELNLLDTGDFVEATGEVIKTKTGEISVHTR
ncbi:hypothetical protein GW746_00390, partial [Candidatus Saccharibacteria bacterium]|nr:hypothetical protein [Candidatus Saccharibacteria bacterium]